MAEDDWRKNLKIQKAAEITKQFDYAGVIILGFTKDGGSYELSSYGMTRPICRALGGLADALGAEIEDSGLPTDDVNEAIFCFWQKIEKLKVEQVNR